MTRITRREAAQAWNLGAPLDMALKYVPAKRKAVVNPDREWHLQRDCIAATRALIKVKPHLAFMAPGAAQNNLKPAQRGFAKLMGWQAGLADIWLMKRGRYAPPTLALHVVELKLPGKPLSEDQSRWFDFLQSAGVACSRVDTLEEYLKILHAFAD